ncbi:MAG: c-type cytochrome [Ignavibacteria bacterium]|nr:c-type cytochrome [Ignavibacteria bacterium]
MNTTFTIPHVTSNVIAMFCAAILLIGCDAILPSAPNDADVLDGPVDALSSAQHAQFLRGDVAFNDDVFTAATGLGPIFVATSCGSCHAGDGKGHPFTTLTRFGQGDENGNAYLDRGGPQLQNRALPGYTPEQIPGGAPFTKLTPPANTGLGFMELVSDADIIAMSDENDADGDGVSGVPNWRPLVSYLSAHQNSIPTNEQYIHRFGKKAAAYNLLHQTVNAYNQDIGITSIFEPKDVYSGVNIEPEVSASVIHDVVFYLQTLKVPVERNPNDEAVKNGKRLFIQIGCDNCHKQTLKTAYSPVAALRNKEFHPYTDLLLHDMGKGLDDGYTEGSAKTYEWRTPALWGLGLSQNSQGGEYFLLHDGRAKSITSAIVMHGGEAAMSTQKFQALTEAEKRDILKFLEQL